MSKSPRPIKLDVATGLAWLQAFVAKSQADVTKWSVAKLDNTFAYQGIPDETTARKLADFVAAKYRVDAHIYEPMGSGWQVVVMRR